MKKKIFAGIVSLAVLAGLAVPVSVSLNREKQQNTAATNPASVVWEEKSSLSTYDDDDVLQVHFIDVGQGDSILLQQAEEAMLIDAGGNDKGDYVVDYCERAGVHELKYVVGTHAHEDHIGGLDDVIRDLEVDNILITPSDYPSVTYEEVLNAVEERHVQEIIPKAGDTFRLGEAEILVTAPNRQDYREENNRSIILKITYGEISYLFCGDAEIESEYDMTENGLDITADVIKIGHHGSDTSTSQMLLKTVRPQYAVISVGADNAYGHPMSSVLNRLNAYGIPYLRTDEEGTIVSVTDGKQILWSSNPVAAMEEIAETTEDIAVTYVINLRTKKFHQPDCESVGEIAEKNREDYRGDRDSLIAEGYMPCKRCNP